MIGADQMIGQLVDTQVNHAAEVSTFYHILHHLTAHPAGVKDNRNKIAFFKSREYKFQGAVGGPQRRDGDQVVAFNFHGPVMMHHT